MDTDIDCGMMEDDGPKVSIAVSLINADNEMSIILLNNTESFSEFSFSLASASEGNELETDFDIDLSSNEFGYSLSANETSGKGYDEAYF